MWCIIAIIIGQVVPLESAIIGHPRENRETIHDDHIGMVKFSMKDDPGYKKVLHSIEMLLEELDEDSGTPKPSVYKLLHSLRIKNLIIPNSGLGHQWTPRGKSYSTHSLSQNLRGCI